MTTERQDVAESSSDSSEARRHGDGCTAWWTWNQGCRSDRFAVFVGICALLIAIPILLLHTQLKYGLNAPPPVTGDELEYDSLGWELSQGRGYQIDISNADFRQPYGTLVDTVSSAGPSPTAYRPPLVPLIIAGLNTLFGRQFWAMRIVNILATSASCGIIVGLATRWGGPLAGLIAIVHFLMIDWRVRAFGRSLLTESLTLFWVTLLFVLLLRLSSRCRISTALQAGSVLGLAILTRSMLVIWMLPLCAYIGFRSQTNVSRRSWILAGAFAVSALAVVLPWAIRNLLVLERFLPLGTQFQIESSSGYSDMAVSRYGLWFNLRDEGFFPAEIDVGRGLEREKKLADYSSGQALQWIKGHPLSLPGLAAWKMLQEIRPWGIGELYLSVLGVMGLIALRRTPVGLVAFCLIASCLLGIAMSWSTGGRFIFPVLSSLHLGAAIAAVRMLEASLCQPIDGRENHLTV